MVRAFFGVQTWVPAEDTLRFVSCIHLVVGLFVMSVFWATKLVPFQKPDAAFWRDVTWPSFLHAFGHCLTNVSFAAVAVSFTHTVKTLEPVFSAAGSYLVNGTVYPLPVYLALLPIMAGVALASATELSFTWLGFSTAMASNVAFAGRAIYSKALMSRVSAVNLYNFVTIVALAFCIPPTIFFEGSTLSAGLQVAASKVGAKELTLMLFNVGLYYHLYNQVCRHRLRTKIGLLTRCSPCRLHTRRWKRWSPSRTRLETWGSAFL